MASKEVRELIRKLQEQGWRIEEGKHYKAFSPDRSKPPVIIPKTPSDSRWKKNTIAQLRRSGAQL